MEETVALLTDDSNDHSLRLLRLEGISIVAKLLI